MSLIEVERLSKTFARPVRRSGRFAALRSLLAEGFAEVASAGKFRWILHLGDFSRLIQELPLPSPDAILYDPYSPAVNPEMWTLEHFQNLRRCLSPGTRCLLTNYTRSTAVRVTLLLGGFFVGRGAGTGEKEETTVAASACDLLDRPLGSDWLKRVRGSTNSAPLTGRLGQRGTINEADLEALLFHPQFQQSSKRSKDSA